jgi:hypothetical protein
MPSSSQCSEYSEVFVTKKDVRRPRKVRRRARRAKNQVFLVRFDKCDHVLSLSAIDG